MDERFKNDNPFLDSLPKMINKNEFMAAMKGSPFLPVDIKSRGPEERRALLTTLDSWYEPLDYMYVLYDMLYRAIVSTYRTKTLKDSVRQINSLYYGMRDSSDDKDETDFSTQAYSGAVLGVPGIGKTSAIKRCLSLIPQVVVHSEYQGMPFYTKQINYLVVECPSDCSVKTLAFNIFYAIDRAIGSNYLTQAYQRSPASTLSSKIKIICLNHHVGLIVIDEIQNAILTADRKKQTRPLIKFLVELTNDTSTSVCFCGTLESESLFLGQEHLKRRTRGLRLLPLKYDLTYRRFITKLWEYQLTKKKAVLTEKLMKQIYDLSGGIPAYIIKIFQEAQAQAILSGTEKISYEMIKQAVSVLGIEVPQVYGGKGTSISDFTITAEELMEDDEAGTGTDAEPAAKCETASAGYTEPEPVKKQAPAKKQPPVKRYYATKRGRPQKEREENDILYIWEQKEDVSYLMGILDGFGMTERRCY